MLKNSSAHALRFPHALVGGCVRLSHLAHRVELSMLLPNQFFGPRDAITSDKAESPLIPCRGSTFDCQDPSRVSGLLHRPLRVVCEAYVELWTVFIWLPCKYRTGQGFLCRNAHGANPKLGSHSAGCNYVGCKNLPRSLFLVSRC
jgi:hypothetical protein